MPTGAKKIGREPRSLKPQPIVREARPLTARDLAKADNVARTSRVRSRVHPSEA